MADYRIASLTKNRQRSVVQEHDTTGFITLEALMLARQDEERRQAALLTPRARSPLQNNNINNTNNNNNRLLSSHHHPYHHNNLQATSNAAAIQQRAPTHARLSQEHNNHNQNHNQHAAIVNNQTRRSFKNHNQVKFYANNNNNAQPLLSPRSASSHRRENSSPSTTDDSKTGKKMSFTNCLYKHAVDTTARDYRDGSPEKFWIDSLRSTTTDSRNKHALKKAALYQPPPVAPLDNSGLSDQSHMRLAFEMLLDQNSQGVSGTMGRRGSGNKAAADTPTPAARLKSLFTGKPDQKTLLGSPRLHKAIFRNSSRGDSGGESLNSPPLSPPEEDADVIPLHNEHPSSSPPTPDYPGLEYPPVFEPGTYSLSDASTILRGRGGGGGGGGSRDHPPSNR